MKLYKIKENKVIGEVYTFLNKKSNGKEYLDYVVREIKKSSNGYAGFKSKKFFKNHLKHQILNEKKLEETFSEVNFEKIIKIIEESLKLCKKALGSEKTKIYVFQSQSNFIENKMNGVSGFSPWKNTIHIYINTYSDDWKTGLKNTLAHEYNHSVVYNYHEWKTLLDSLIFEGLAEHFRDEVFGGKKSPWSSSISNEECKKHFNEIKKHFDSADYELYRNMFFENEKYPMWLGYSLGYNIVDSFLKHNKMLWKDIMILTPKKILEKSNYNK